MVAVYFVLGWLIGSNVLIGVGKRDLRMELEGTKIFEALFVPLIGLCSL